MVLWLSTINSSPSTTSNLPHLVYQLVLGIGDHQLPALRSTATQASRRSVWPLAGQANSCPSSLLSLAAQELAGCSGDADGR